MASIVLVPGGWHGGWWFAPAVADLRRLGHQVFAVTPTGLGERSHLADGTVNLDTHVQDVLSTLEYEQLDDVVLCGHSYGGTVITAVADRAPHRCSALVYVDAQVPRDGESHWEITEGSGFLDRGVPDGKNLQPPAGLDPRATPHPLASFTQPVRLSGAWLQVAAKYYVWASAGFGGGDASPTKVYFDRYRDDRDWDVRSWAVGHDIVGEARGEFVALLDEVAGGSTARRG